MGSEDEDAKQSRNVTNGLDCDHEPVSGTGVNVWLSGLLGCLRQACIVKRVGCDGAVEPNTFRTNHFFCR